MAFNDKDGGGGGRPTVIDGDLQNCWSCHGSVSNRALFCHSCGSLQAPRGLDHFARLNMPRRFDISASDLERQITGFQRALAPERFASRPPREQALAQGQRAVLQESYRTLKDPVRRARYLLELTGKPHGRPNHDEAVDALRAELESASDAAGIDRIAHAAARHVEDAVGDLTAAFRRDDAAEAASVLARLEQAEELVVAARARRTALQDANGNPEAT